MAGGPGDGGEEPGDGLPADDPSATQRDLPSALLAIRAPGVDEVTVLPWPLLLRRRILDRAQASTHYPWFVLCTGLYGLFTVGFTITILSVSIPRIADDLSSTESTLTWLVTGPILAFAIFGPSAGKLGDLYGQRRVYGISMACASIFAGLTALSWSAGSLIAFRILGAATGAALGPTTLAMINRSFPPERRTQAMGYWAMVAAGGPVVGVVAGGPIVEVFGWRWIFAAQVPLTALGLLIAMAVLPDSKRVAGQAFDVPGALALAASSTVALVAVNRGPIWGWGDPRVLAGFALAPIGLAAFLAIERASPHPLLPLEYLRRRNFSLPITTQVFTNFAYMGGFIMTPLLLQNEFGYGESRTGTLLIARPIAFAIMGPIAGFLTMRVGERLSGTTGALAVCLSMVGLATLAPGSSDLMVVGALALSGIGLGLSAPAMAATMANAVDEADLGVAGATQQMMTQFGVVVGIQVMQTLQVARADSVGAVDAYGEAFMLGAVVAALGVIAAVFVRSTPRTVEEPGGLEPALAGGAAATR